MILNCSTNVLVISCRYLPNILNWNIKKRLQNLFFSVFGTTGTSAFGAQQSKPAFGGSTFGGAAGGGGK